MNGNILNNDISISCFGNGTKFSVDFRGMGECLDRYAFRGRNSLFLYLPPILFGVNSKRQEFAPVRANSFL